MTDEPTLTATTMGELARLAKQLDRDRFLARCPGPALVGLGHTQPGPDTDTGFRTMDGSAGAAGSLEITAASRVWWVCKTQSNFPDKITLGRSRNNDITIQDSNVSKLHCYITGGEGAYKLTDAESLNGTTVGTQPLSAMEPRRLENGDEISLGGGLTVMFCTPDGLLMTLAMVRLEE